jgi:hypothetical protein
MESRGERNQGERIGKRIGEEGRKGKRWKGREVEGEIIREEGTDGGERNKHGREGKRDQGERRKGSVIQKGRGNVRTRHGIEGRKTEGKGQKKKKKDRRERKIYRRHQNRDG